jgi:hypothetical protein
VVEKKNNNNKERKGAVAREVMEESMVEGEKTM